MSKVEKSSAERNPGASHRSVEGARSEYLQIPKHMADDVSGANKSGHRHEHLLPVEYL
jgi:hypothetical protein